MVKVSFIDICANKDEKLLVTKNIRRGKLVTDNDAKSVGLERNSIFAKKSGIDEGKFVWKNVG